MNDELSKTEGEKRPRKVRKRKPKAVATPSNKDEGMREKIILAIINAVVISGSVGLITQQFFSLKNFEDVKFEMDKIECLSPNCDTARQRFFVYRFGEKPIPNVNFKIKIDNSDYTIVDGTQSVKEIEKSLFFSSEGKETGGSKITFQDPELSTANSYGYKLPQLSSDWIYKLQFDVKTTGDNSFKNYIIFQIDDEAKKRYKHQNRTFYDYLRLYLIEALVISIFFVIILGFLIWFGGKRFITSRRGELE